MVVIGFGLMLFMAMLGLFATCIELQRQERQMGLRKDVADWVMVMCSAFGLLCATCYLASRVIIAVTAKGGGA